MAPRTVAGRYELADRLGSGGGGVVWRAHDTSLGRTVAVKEIELAHDVPDDERERLQIRALREARAAAQLEDRHVVTVYDVQSTDDAIFIIMEFVDAPSLQHVVATEGPLTPDEAARVGLDVLGALQAAHAAGIVHRDIKPSNVLVRGPNGAQVTDFGIAAVTDDASLTMTGQALGTPDYVSPEQVSDRPVGPATDVWSLGATLYHAVEGQAPFRRDRAVSTVHAVVNASPHPMARAGPLAGVVTAMLAKDPADRPSVAEVRSQLSSVLEGGSVQDATAAMAPVADETVRMAPATADPTRESPAPAATPPARPTPAEPRRTARERQTPPRTAKWAAAVIGLLLLAVVAAMLLANDLGTEPGDTTVQPTDTATDPEPPPETSTPSPQDTTPAETTEATEDPSPSPEPTTTAPETTAPETEPTDPPSPEPTTDAVTVPAGWQVYQGPSYTVAHPEGWTTRDAPASAVDLVSPDSPAYLRVANTDSPAEDVLADTQQIAEAFQRDHEGYEQLRLEPTNYRDTEAVIWEYTFFEGQTYRAAHLNLSTGENGYALNYVAVPSVWQQHPDRWEQFTASFAPQ